MPPFTMDTTWHGPALRLRDEGKDAVEVGEAVGKHPATVRKLFARNPPASTNGHATIDAETVERLRAAAIPGQATVDDHLAPNGHPCPVCGELCDEPGVCPECVAPPEDDPRHPDTLVDFRGVAPDPEPEPLDFEERLKGTRQLALDFGPNAEPAVGGLLKLKSDSLASGFYGLGDVITGTFTARVVDVVGKERLQRASGEFRMQPQGHVALVTEITVDS